MPEVAWVVPLALGDSHRGFRVLGTSPEFFERVIPSPSSGALFAAGGAFEQVLEAVVGADVAEALGSKQARERDHKIDILGKRSLHRRQSFPE